MTDGRQITEEEATRAAEYVLGLMSAADRRAFEAEMAVFPALRDEVLGWDEDLVPLADGFDEVQPAKHVQARLETRLFGGPQKTGLFASFGLWRGLAGAALAGAAAIALLLALPRNTPPVPSAPVLVSQVAGEDGALQLTAAFNPGDGVLQVNRVSGEAPAGRVLELWLIAGQDAPVSLGVLPANRRGRIAVPAALAARFENATLAISDEPPGGSPTGAPTGSVLATGAVTAL